MTQDKSYPARQATDDKIVVAEMLRDSSSGQWHECSLFVNRLVQSQAHNIPYNQWDDIVQEAMIRIHRYLPSFQFQCAFRTWIFNIVHSCTIDAYRKLLRAGQNTVPLGDSYDDVELESDRSTANVPATIEDECIIRDELQNALTALQEYVSLHSNSKRNREILDMVLFENRSLEEVAQVVGCSAPVAGYVVRSARRYVRERLEYH